MDKRDPFTPFAQKLTPASSLTSLKLLIIDNRVISTQPYIDEACGRNLHSSTLLCCGSCRIAAELKSEGHVVNRKRIQGIMRDLGLAGK